MTNESNSRKDDFLFIWDKVQQLSEEWFQHDKHANILVIGKTGVGKSTLINTVFRDELATTGVGRPVTQGFEEITKPGMPITIVDSKGLELVDFAKIRDSLIAEVKARQGEDADRYIHLAWLCISEESKRIEDGEIELARSLNEIGVAIIVVITKASKIKNNEFKEVVQQEFRGICKEVHLTRSLEEVIYNDDDKEIDRRKIMGIDELISSSYLYIPESQRRSFANALSLKHKNSIEVKRKEADGVIKVATAAAAAAAAIPLPFSDALALIPIQITMVMAMSKVFGMEIDKSFALPVVSALMGSTAATLAGRTLFSTLLKFIPGLGSVAGGIIGAGLASQLTQQMGHIYLGVLIELAEDGRPLELTSAMALLRTKLGM